MSLGQEAGPDRPAAFTNHGRCQDFCCVGQRGGKAKGIGGSNRALCPWLGQVARCQGHMTVK